MYLTRKKPKGPCDADAFRLFMWDKTKNILIIKNKKAKLNRFFSAKVGKLIAKTGEM